MARSRLTDEYRSEPVLVGMYLCAQMHDAIADLAAAQPVTHQEHLAARGPAVTPAGFYTRFLGWVRTDR